MTKAEYITKVQAHVDDTSARAQTIIETAIDATYRDVLHRAGMYFLNEEETSDQIVLGMRYINLASDTLRVNRVFSKPTTATDYKELRRMDMDMYNPNIEDGEVGQFYVKGTRLYFERNSDDASLLKIQYVPQVDVDTGLPMIDNDSVIIYGACAKFFSYEGDSGSAEYESRYQMEMKTYMDTLTTQQKTLKPKLYG